LFHKVGAISSVDDFKDQSILFFNQPHQSKVFQETWSGAHGQGLFNDLQQVWPIFALLKER